MKRQKAIEDLATKAAGIEFPGFNAARERFQSALRELVSANFGYSAGREMHYDETSRTYFWERVETVAMVDQSCIRISRTFAINPCNPLVEEFARIAAEHEEMEGTRHAVARRVVNDLGGSL